MNIAGSTFALWDDLLRRLYRGFDDVSAIITTIEEILVVMHCRSVGAMGIEVERHGKALKGLLEWLKERTHEQVRDEAAIIAKSNPPLVLPDERNVIHELTERLEALCPPSKNNTLRTLVIILEELVSRE